MPRTADEIIEWVKQYGGDLGVSVEGEAFWEWPGMFWRGAKRRTARLLAFVLRREVPGDTPPADR